MESVIVTTLTSLIFQIMIGILCIHGLSFELDENKKVLQELLLIETLVQGVEFLFYIFILYTIVTKGVSDVTAIRYFDWFLTTPTMLFTIIVYTVFKTKNSGIVSVSSVFQEHWKDIVFIIVCNAMMLIFGYLGEIGVINLYHASVIGFGFLIATFFTIYEKFVKKSDIVKEFFVIFSIWSLYGIAALLDPVSKNNMYNTLDIFSKNIMGMFLYYQVRNSQKITKPKGF